MNLCIPSSIISSTSFHFTVTFLLKISPMCLFFNFKGNKYLSSVFFFFSKFHFSSHVFYCKKTRQIRKRRKLRILKRKSYASTLALFPKWTGEIWRPWLETWLKRRQDLKVEMNGNCDKTQLVQKYSYTHSDIIHSIEHRQNPTSQDSYWQLNKRNNKTQLQVCNHA